MRRNLLSLAIFLLALTNAKGQSAKPDCSSYNGGAFYYYTPHDTIIVYRGMEYWIQVDIRKNECDVYKINWTDACHFTLKANSIVKENKNYAKGSTAPLRKASFSVDSIGVNGITYKIKKDSNVAYTETLHPLKDSIPWEYLIYADSNLYNDTTEIKRLYGTPAHTYYCNVPYFIGLVTDSGETHFVDYVISLFQNGDMKPAFEYATENLHKHSPEAVVDDYNQYVQHLFGKLYSYKTTSIKDGFRVNKKTFSHTYIIHGQFEKMHAGADLCITVGPESTHPLISLSVAVDSATKIPFLNTLSSPFWEAMKQKKYHKIYDSAAPALKLKKTYAEAENTFKSIDSAGHLNDYTLYFQNFMVTGERGMIVLSYKFTLPDKSPSISLLYIFENGEYKLAGINSTFGKK